MEHLQPILAWRIDRLRAAGFPAGLAATVARDPRYDMHALLELTGRGTPTARGLGLDEHNEPRPA